MADQCTRTLKRRRGACRYSSIRDLPDSTSKWLQSEEMKTHVFRVFKTRRLKIDVEKIIWPYSLSGMDCDTWFSQMNANNKYEQFQKFFSDCLSPIDFDPHDWFHRTCHTKMSKCKEKAESDLALQTRKLMIDVMGSRNHAVQNNSADNHLVAQMEKAFKYWIASLTHLLRRSPSKLNESAYEHLFEAFAQLFGLSCMPGDMEKLEIQYEVQSGGKTVAGVRSQPDLILYRYDEVPSEYVNAEPVAVIKITNKTKRLKTRRSRVLSRAKKQGFHEAQTVKAELETHSSAPKTKRVTFVEDNSHPSEYEKVSSTGPLRLEGDSSGNTVAAVAPLPGSNRGNVENQNSPDTQSVAMGLECQSASPDRVGSQNVLTEYEEIRYGEVPPNADIPSKEEIRSWNNWLPQLLGEVVAAGSLRRDGDKQTSLGIAVNGYSVTFLNFCSQGHHQFDDIPLTPGAGMDIFISEQLCLLKKTDREKICKILLYLTTFKLPF